jgi:hypothetical protein
MVIPAGLAGYRAGCPDTNIINAFYLLNKSRVLTTSASTHATFKPAQLQRADFKPKSHPHIDQWTRRR